MALLGSGGAPGDALTPVIIQAEDLLHLLPGDFDCHLHDGERCNTNSRESPRRLNGKPGKVHACLHQPAWWRASNEMNTEYFSLSHRPKKKQDKLNGNEPSAAFCALNISRQSNLEKLSGRRKHGFGVGEGGRGGRIIIQAPRALCVRRMRRGLHCRAESQTPFKER